MLLGAKTANRYELLAEIARLRAELDEVAGHRCAYAQGAHGIAGCGRCFDCVRSENVKLRAARLRPETVDAAKLALSLRESSMQNIRHLVPKEINNVAAALADLNRAYPEED